MMDQPHSVPPPADFSPETCGRIMDFVKTKDISYAHLKAEAERLVRQTRWSGAGKNMGVLGSFEPSRFHDTFVGNFRRAGVYKKIPARTPVQYEYGLDENDRLLAAISPLFELDAYATPVVMMAPVAGDALDPSVEAAYRQALGYTGEIEQMERYAFYDRARKAFAVVVTGETRKYGNVILKKGVPSL